MLFAICAFLLTVPLLVFYAIFGMATMPAVMREDLKKDEVIFLVSPFWGACIWVPLTIFSGLHTSYCSTLLAIALILSSILIYSRRKSLVFPREKTLIGLLAVLFLFTFIFCRFTSPWTSDGGGLCFSCASYDYTKSAIIDAIAAKGLFPCNPWLADHGQSVPLVYYFGWHAWAAQLCMLAGVSGYMAEVITAAFTFLIISMFLCGVAWKFTGRRLSIVFTVFYLTFATEFWSTLSEILPSGAKTFLFSSYPGFWSLYDNFIWSPQHMFGGCSVLVVLFLYWLLLRSTDFHANLILAVYLGVTVAAGLYTSVYAAAFPCVWIGGIVLVFYACSPGFRHDFNRTFFAQVLAGLVMLSLTAMYLFYLFRYPSEDAPLAVGIIPCYGADDSFLRSVCHWFNFYFSVLPMRLGLVYVFGMLAIFIPRVLPKTRASLFATIFVLFSFLIIFFVHTTYYSNDFGWRSIAAAHFILILFAVILSVKAWQSLICASSGVCRRFAIATVAILVAAQLYCFSDAIQMGGVGIHLGKREEHIAFAEAVDGWKVVHSHTGRNDMVICNPKGFFSIGCIYNNDEDYTNIFFALYARRRSPIGDCIFAKCYSEYYDGEKLNARYERAVRVFAGNADRPEIDWFADELQIRAILVTPLDGLWNVPGNIADRYDLIADASGYRVYLLRD